MRGLLFLLTLIFAAMPVSAFSAPADPTTNSGVATHPVDPSARMDFCVGLPNHDQLRAALKQARVEDNGGLNTDMWGAVISRDGTVCAIAYTGVDYGAQWPGSRAISIEKANTANSFSLKKLALSTANLYAMAQPEGSLYGLINSQPVDTASMYAGPVSAFGAVNDPMVGKTASGIIVFGGGLALYNKIGEIVGAVGVSGDTSCADHNIAWRTRSNLKLDFIPAGVASDRTDAIIYDIRNGKSASGFGHPLCGQKEDFAAKTLPKIEKQEIPAP